MSITPLSLSKPARLAASNFANAFSSQKTSLPNFDDLPHKIIQNKGGNETQIITAATIADLLEKRFGSEKTFKYHHLADMLSEAGWNLDDIQCQDGINGAVTKLQAKYGNDKTFTFAEAGKLFANLSSLYFPNQGMTKEEAQNWGLVAK